MIAEKTSWSQHGAQLETKRTILNVDRLYAVVLSKIEPIIVGYLKWRIDREECVNRLWSGRLSYFEEIATLF